MGEDISEALYEILSSLLSDRLSYSEPEPIQLQNKVFSGASDKINTMLHWDGVEHVDVNYPGAIYYYPNNEIIEKYFFEPKNEDLKSFIYSNYIANNGDNGSSINRANEDADFDENIKLVLLDATPPCDHGNNKAIWRKLVLGIMVRNNEKTKSYLKSDYIKSTPVFLISNIEKYFIFNSNLIVTLPDKGNVLRELGYIGRLREQLLRDYVSWLGGMITRPGIVSVR